MKRHYANLDGNRLPLPPRHACRSGVRPADPSVSRRHALPPPRDPFEDAFAELLASEPPDCKGLVLAY